MLVCAVCLIWLLCGLVWGVPVLVLVWLLCFDVRGRSWRGVCCLECCGFVLV